MNTGKRLALGATVIFLLGSAFHFTYQLLGSHIAAGLIFPVNESVAEHLKMLSTAALAWLAADYFLAKRQWRHRVFAARAFALPAALLLIPVVHYFLEGAFGFSHFIIDILLFLAACLLYQYMALRLEAVEIFRLPPNTAGLLILLAIAALLAVFTVWPPEVPMFMVPNGG